MGIPWVVLLGHETYYPRFGFAPASRWNLTGDYGSHDAFQFLRLTARRVGRISNPSQSLAGEELT